MDSTHADARYADVTKRLNVITSLGALGITLLQVAALWGRWHEVETLLGIQLALIAFNVWTNLFALARWGRRAEIVRTLVNAGSTVVVLRWIGWTLPVYLWVPFVALSFDHLGRGLAFGVLAAIAATFVTSAFFDGQPWIYPVTFTAFAAFAWEISRVRFGNMREMILESDRHRADLERAHVAVQQAYARLAQEVAVRERVERELRQAQKLEAVGRLAAGVAHEINTPVQFVTQNVEFIREGIDELLTCIARARAIRREALAGRPLADAVREVEAIEAEVDLPYLTENLGPALEDSLAGLERIAAIVRAMKRFAHPEQSGATVVDLNEAVASTLTIARHEYKLVADVETRFGSLPPVTCHAGEINQVVLNLVVNAAHAIAEVVGDSGRRGRILVETTREEDGVVVSVADTGTGIPESIQDRIFDPFFTTKEVGEGTGQGLAIARSVAEAHGGTLTFTTDPGQGSTFRLRLPHAAETAQAA